MEQSQFEFLPEHDREFIKTAYWMGILGRLAMIVGVLQVLGGVLQLLGATPELAWSGLLGGAIYAVVGYFTNRVAGSFRAIATSAGHDIDHLMVALQALKQLFRLMTLGVFLLLLLGIAAGVAIGLLGAA
ncbi:MAG: hypothetical protein AAGE01_06480 [Pseudomonadota bacterium]